MGGREDAVACGWPNMIVTLHGREATNVVWTP